MSWHQRSAIVVWMALAFGVGACHGQRDKSPDLQTKTPEQRVDQPLAVTGCLRQGLAENTFVLTAARTEGSVQTATYNLAGREDEFRSQVGQEVEVSGTVRSEQTVATSGKLEEKPARGAQGTPNVETRSELEVRRLDVSTIKPTGNRCPSER